MYVQTMTCIIVILAAPDFIALSHSCCSIYIFHWITSSLESNVIIFSSLSDVVKITRGLRDSILFYANTSYDFDNHFLTFINHPAKFLVQINNDENPILSYQIVNKQKMFASVLYKAK